MIAYIFSRTVVSRSASPMSHGMSRAVSDISFSIAVSSIACGRGVGHRCLGSGADSAPSRYSYISRMSGPLSGPRRGA